MSMSPVSPQPPSPALVELAMPPPVVRTPNGVVALSVTDLTGAADDDAHSVRSVATCGHSDSGDLDAFCYGCHVDAGQQRRARSTSPARSASVRSGPLDARPPPPHALRRATSMSMPGAPAPPGFSSLGMMSLPAGGALPHTHPMALSMTLAPVPNGHAHFLRAASQTLGSGAVPVAPVVPDNKFTAAVMKSRRKEMEKQLPLQLQMPGMQLDTPVAFY
ncbi:hypothetical protein DFJ74DRAFT_660302 [Hyaloraphidium curvatum]|nr:hypothetical protein DFJ74DRAFT_660302 [Hyaloraphidium curvatum]